MRAGYIHTAFHYLKRFARRLSIKLGLDPAFIRSILSTGSSGAVYDEFRYRLRGAPDGFPLPSPYLIWLIIGTPWITDYIEGGMRGERELVRNLGRFGIDFDDFGSMLDFGCGCGRLLRCFALTNVLTLSGTDYNSRLIQWCKKKLPFATFDLNGLEPPLNYDNGSFDFVFAGSVFTHLGEELQMRWIKELERVTKPEGIIYFTTHGEARTHILTEEQKSLFASGKVVIFEETREGENFCASFESRTFVENNLLDGMELVGFIPAGTESFGAQDIYIAKKNINHKY